MLPSRKSLGLVLSLAFLTACHEAPRHAEASAEPTPVRAKSVAAASVEWPSIYEAVGTVRARTSAVISSKVMGYVRDVKTHTGDHVAAGQLLLQLDSRDLDVALRQAQAGRDEAQNASEEATKAIASSQANLDLAKSTFRRMDDLYQKKSISNQEYDEAGAKLKVAQAAYDMTLSRRAQTMAKIQQADQAIASASVMRAYSEVRAPFAGTVTEKQAEPGTLATPGAPLLTIEQAAGLRLEVPVEESYLATTKVGQPVTVKLDALDRSLTARVSEIDPSVDPASRAFTVKIDLPAIPQLRSGLYGRAQFSRGARQVVVVPAEAISEQGQIQSVLVVENGIARTRIVTAGQRNSGQVEILSGLSAGEQVISPRPAALADGSRVEAFQ